MVPEGGGPLPAHEEGTREGGRGPQQAPLAPTLVLLAHLPCCGLREQQRERGMDGWRRRMEDGGERRERMGRPEAGTKAEMKSEQKGNGGAIRQREHLWKRDEFDRKNG